MSVTRPTQRYPNVSVFSRSEEQKHTAHSFDGVLFVLFGALLLLAASWFILRAASQPAAARSLPAGASLELALSGTLTSNMSFAADEMALSCTATGFTVQSADPMVTPLALAYTGPSGRSSSLLPSAQSSLELTVSRAAYALQSGTMTQDARVRTFNATFLDAQSQPLQLSGRLVCP